MPDRGTEKPIDAQQDALPSSVYSSIREVKQPDFLLPSALEYNTRLKMEGRQFLAMLPDKAFSAAFFDPQYRGILDKLGYGNEGKDRGKARCSLPQMTDHIPDFIRELNRVLMPSAHLFLWIDKFHLCTGVHDWLAGTSLEIVDMITWDKKRMGMGYRTRRTSEHLLVLQRTPRRAKGVWKVHNIRDVWPEKVKNGYGVHPKPVGLQGELIEAVTNAGDVVIDPASGSFSVMEACKLRGRNFLGCDING